MPDHGRVSHPIDPFENRARNGEGPPYGAPTKEQMDLVHQRGLKVIYSMKDAYFGTKWCPKEIASEEEELVFIKAKIDAFREHPALMAWYINDELSLDMLERLSLHRKWLEELDPDHPTWVVLYQVDSVRDYAPTFDVIGTGPYPILAGHWHARQVVVYRQRTLVVNNRWT